MEYIKLGKIATVEISGVDKKTTEGEQEVRLCNFVDVYHNWAITSGLRDNFMSATAKSSEIDKFKLRKGQVAITKDSETRDDIGIPTYIADTFDDVILGYHCALITPNEEKLTGKYLNALLHSDYAKKYFECNASGSGQRYTLSIDTLNDFPVPMRSIEEQKRIGHILSSIDKKICLNKAINHNLEVQVNELYNQWFIHFNFPGKNGLPYKANGGIINFCNKYNMHSPEGWSIVPIGLILDKYPSTKRFETNLYKDFGKYPIVDQGDKYIVGYTDDEENVLKRIPAVLFGDHSTKVKFLNFEFGRGADGTQILYSNCQNVYQFYLYLSIKHLTIPNPGYSRHFKYLKELPIIIPDQGIADQFEKICHPLYLVWTSNTFNNIELMKLRDNLLPLLINGQISTQFFSIE